MVSYTYLGYGTTNSEGVAHLDHDADGEPIDHSYTGVGAGEIDVLASLDNPIVDGSIVSGPYNVWDTIAYFDGVVNNHFKNATETIVDDGIQVTSTYQNIFFQKNGTQLFIPTDTDFAVEFYLKFNSGSSGFYAGFTTANDTRGTNMQVAQQTTNNLYKLTVVDGVFTLYRDGVEVNHTSISFSVANCGFCITDWQQDLDVTIKDFKVYPL